VDDIAIGEGHAQAVGGVSCDHFARLRSEQFRCRRQFCKQTLDQFPAVLGRKVLQSVTGSKTLRQALAEFRKLASPGSRHPKQGQHGQDRIAGTLRLLFKQWFLRLLRWCWAMTCAPAVQP